MLFPPDSAQTKGEADVPAEDPAAPWNCGDDPEFPPPASPNPTQESPSRVEDIFAIFATSESPSPPIRSAQYVADPDGALIPQSRSRRELECLINAALRITHKPRTNMHFPLEGVDLRFWIFWIILATRHRCH